MRHLFAGLFFLCLLQVPLEQAQSKEKIDSMLPVRGLAIAAPTAQSMDSFIKFIENELVPAHFNLLILRVDWNYAYESHPELRGSNPLSKDDVKKIVSVCKKHNIKIAPQLNLLGHQSWGKTTHSLLRVYPQFDETPHVKTEDYTTFPNPDGLYVKSYCPLHPDVHKIVYAAVDELMDVFECEYFHAGMDEVFYIGDDKCPRCSGRDKAELFAGEVTKIRNHLALKNRKLMIWGDRLLDGKTTGLGMWEASMNNTHRAIDLIPKDIFICDWHYEQADLTCAYFALKGFTVATCPWRRPEVTAIQLKNMVDFRQQSLPVVRNRFHGMVQTVWSGVDAFLKLYYDPETCKIPDGVDPRQNPGGDVRSLKRLIEAFKKLNQ